MLDVNKGMIAVERNTKKSPLFETDRFAADLMMSGMQKKRSVHEEIQKRERRRAALIIFTVAIVVFLSVIFFYLGPQKALSMLPF